MERFQQRTSADCCGLQRLLGQTLSDKLGLDGESDLLEGDRIARLPAKLPRNG